MKKYAGLLSPVLAVILALTALTVEAAEPCAPFEGGRVDAKSLQVMRDAAREGRLYRIVPGKSRVGFCVRHFPFQEFRGEFSNIVGGLALPPEPKGQGQALLLIRATNMKANNAELVPLVQSREFMDIERYPEILFVGRAFQWLSPGKGYIYGDLTLHGKTRPVVFNVGVDVLDEGKDGKTERIHLQGTGQVDRYGFDMRNYRFLVSETVKLCLSVELVHWAP